MHTISAKLTLLIPHSESLKDKRQVRRSLLDGARHKFNASFAEVDTQDSRQILTIGIALVSNEFHHAQRCLDEIIRYIEETVVAELVDVELY